jgi:hypothetical protein
MGMKLLFAGILLFAVPVFGQSRQCKSNPKVVGACYIVHGRATFGPGTPALRIWPVGTKRMLGVTAGPIADDADDPIAPNEMLIFTPDVEGIFGDFEVCPFTPERKGHMQMVCVESAKNIVVKH